MNEHERNLFLNAFNQLCLNLFKFPYYHTSCALIKDNKIIKVIMNYNDTTIDSEFHSRLIQKANDLQADSIFLLGEIDLFDVELPKDACLLNTFNNCELLYNDIPGKERHLFGVFMDNSFENIKSLVTPIKTDPKGIRYTTDEKWIDYSVLKQPYIIRKETQ